ncbi:KpsF/GutQ family sugar-phosphate isomerase [soil metagenome]
MSAAAPLPLPSFDRIAFARRVILAEADALRIAAERLGEPFIDAVGRLASCKGRVVVIGVGKSADIGQKIVGTFNSTGTRAYLLDATRAVHGDLGAVAPDDVALLLSHSGESEELLRLLYPLRNLTAGLIALTGNASGSLAKAVDTAIVYGPISEACPLSLAPSASTTIMLAVGDAIAFCLSEQRSFTHEDFAKFHPAGNLGRKLAAVESAMRTGTELRIASVNDTVRTVFTKARHEGRRTGAVMLLDTAGVLVGLFTDSDLARLLETNNNAAFDLPIAEVMTRSPLTVMPTVRLVEAVELMRSKKISELPVVDSAGHPVGMLDITDLIGLLPPGDSPQSRPPLKLFPASRG